MTHRGPLTAPFTIETTMTAPLSVRTLAALLVAALVGCNSAALPPTADAPSADASAGSEQGLPRVVAGPPVRKTLTLWTTQPASIQAYEQTPLCSKVAGYVHEVLVDIGDRVTKDQPLVRLSAPELVDEQAQRQALVVQAEADVRQAEAAVVAANAAARTAEAQLAGGQAGVLAAEGEYQRWKAESDRITSLATSRVLTQKQADETLNQFRSADAARARAAAAVDSLQAGVEEAKARIAKAEADLASASARVQVAKADLARAATMVAYLEIKAPYDGVVTARHVDTGHFVHAAGGQPQPLVEVARVGRVRIFAAIPEDEAELISSGLESGDPVTVSVQGLNRKIEGHVTRTSWALDPLNRSLNVEVDLPNADEQLRPGMYATVHVRLEQLSDVLTVPAAAILREGETTTCAVVEDGRVVRRPVEPGLRCDGDVEIKSGLAETDTVVLIRPSDVPAGASVMVAGPASK